MRPFRLIWLLLLATSVAQANTARPIVTSEAPESSTVSIYRDPTRDADDVIRFNDNKPLSGYAMITETRTLDLPPGEVVIRFEGVASGIVPQSAVIFEEEVGEKNFDSRLLSQRGLLDAFTGQRVRLRVANDGSGKVREEDATIISQPDQLILRTSRGYEAIKCDGRLSTLLFPNRPADLAAKPTLSMIVANNNVGRKMTVTLAYLAANFDWRADYVATLSNDTRSLKLFGWMTIASKDATAFPQTELSTVAGDVFRTGYDWEDIDAAEQERASDPYSDKNIAVQSDCWPHAKEAAGRLFAPEQAAPFTLEFPEPFGYCDFDDRECNNAGRILVTGSRIAERKDVGDVKIYELPFRTDVQPQSMKQVRFLQNAQIKGEALYTINHSIYTDPSAKLVFRFLNNKKNGGGVPLPAGGIRFFQIGENGRNLVGSGSVEDKSVGEEIDWVINEDVDDSLKITSESVDVGENSEDVLLRIENLNPHAVAAEVSFKIRAVSYSHFSKPVKKRRGIATWRVQIEPGARAEIRFRTTESDDFEE